MHSILRIARAVKRAVVYRTAPVAIQPERGSLFAACGDGVYCDGSAVVSDGEYVEIGHNVYMGPGVSIHGRGGVRIGDHCIIGPEVVIMSVMHHYAGAAMVPYDQLDLLRRVVIERCTWIGMRAMILPGVTIGEGSIVGAGAVVTKTCPPGSILGGNPAEIIGTRDMDHYRSCVENGQFYFKLKVERDLVKTLVRDDR